MLGIITETGLWAKSSYPTSLEERFFCLGPSSWQWPPPTRSIYTMGVMFHFFLHFLGSLVRPLYRHTWGLQGSSRGEVSHRKLGRQPFCKGARAEWDRKGMCKVKQFSGHNPMWKAGQHFIPSLLATGPGLPEGSDLQK